jgi:hypothetical protein
MTTTPDRSEVFAIDFSTLAREIAMDIWPVDQILELHKLSDDEWLRIQQHPKFVAMLAEMQSAWMSAANTAERVKVKAQTGLESQLETYIADISDTTIPLNQRVEAGKFLARLGELDGARDPLTGSMGGASAVHINIYTSLEKPPVVIDATPVRQDPAIPEG